MSEICNYIYLLQTREFITTKTSIYKIGKTSQENLKRFNSYPKGSKLILQIKVNNCDDSEKDIIKIFKSKYKQALLYGTEYFEGNENLMINDFCNYRINGISAFINDLNNDLHILDKNIASKNKIPKNLKVKKTNSKILKDRTCKYCKKKFDFPSKLKRHLNNNICPKMKTKTNTPAVEINNNLEKINDVKLVNNDSKQIDDIQIKCNKCDALFSHKNGLRKHERKNRCKIKNIELKKSKELEQTNTYKQNLILSLLDNYNSINDNETKINILNFIEKTHNSIYDKSENIKII
jgi:prolyl oligopeptidase PreP (S9A serine peptidase family)